MTLQKEKSENLVDKNILRRIVIKRWVHEEEGECTAPNIHLQE
jgi:hypothetical protein